MSLFDKFKKEPQTPSKRPKELDESRDCFGQPKVRLPEGFAQEVLDLEMRMENAATCGIEDVRKLNQHYRIAVEYYAQFDAHKAGHFQRKLSLLLSSPIALRLMDDRVKQEQTTPTKIDLSKSLKLEVGRFNLQAHTVVSGILEGSRVKQARTERMIQDNISRQEAVLQGRIEERCKSRRRSQYHRQA